MFAFLHFNRTRTFSKRKHHNLTLKHSIQLHLLFHFSCVRFKIQKEERERERNREPGVVLTTAQQRLWNISFFTFVFVVRVDKNNWTHKRNLCFHFPFSVLFIVFVGFAFNFCYAFYHFGCSATFIICITGQISFIRFVCTVSTEQK